LAALAIGAGFVFTIELAAREFFFGALFMNVLLLFGRGGLNRRLIPAFAALYVWILLMRLHVLPEVTFH
jgi:hypothetical protein